MQSVQVMEAVPSTSKAAGGTDLNPFLIQFGKFGIVIFRWQLDLEI